MVLRTIVAHAASQTLVKCEELAVTLQLVYAPLAALYSADGTLFFGERPLDTLLRRNWAVKSPIQ